MVYEQERQELTSLRAPIQHGGHNTGRAIDGMDTANFQAQNRTFPPSALFIVWTCFRGTGQMGVSSNAFERV